MPRGKPATATRPGAPLDPPSELEELMTGPGFTEAEADLDDGVEAGFRGVTDRWTSVEARKQKANRIHVTIPDKTTLYDVQGDDRVVQKSDVPLLVDSDLPARVRLYLRCPRCSSLPNAGVHAVSGPNGCPARPQRLVTYCDICAAHGRTRLIFEDHTLEAPPLEIDTASANFRKPRGAETYDRDLGLQYKLETHVRAFHRTEARQRGLLKD